VASVGIETGRCDEPLSIYVVGCKDHGTERSAQPAAAASTIRK
jgi:hypothetical protein